jgi:putative heme-binding domain-containing protein
MDTNAMGFSLGFVAGLAISTVSVLEVAPTRADLEGVVVRSAWSSGPFDVRIAFDRPVDPSVAQAVIGRLIAYGDSDPSVGATSSATSSTRGSLKIAAAKLEDQGKVLALTTDPHPVAAIYRLELPSIRAEGVTDPGVSVKVQYELCGVEVSPVGDTAASTVTWPRLDPREAMAFLRGTAEFARTSEWLNQPQGVSLASMISLPRGRVTLRVHSEWLSEARLGGEAPSQNDSKGMATFRLVSSGEPVLLELTLERGTRPTGRPPKLTATIQEGDDLKTERPVRPDQLRMTWVPIPPAPPAPLENVPDLKGGDPARGAAVFKSDQAKCATCHKMRGEGGNVGPELSDLVGKDRVSIYRDIFAPSALINPGYLTYNLVLKDGRVLAGTVRAQGADSVQVSGADATSTIVPRTDIEEFRPSATSIMPVGLVGVIGDEKLRDLIAFLTSPPNK